MTHYFQVISETNELTLKVLPVPFVLQWYYLTQVVASLDCLESYSDA